MKHGNIIVSREGCEVTTLKAMQTQTMKERLGGLLVLAPLQSNEGLWISPCNSVHTFGMKYVLDLVYVDKHDKVCGLVNSVKPWRVSLCLKAKAVIEMTAGSLQSLDLKCGDSCSWQD